MYIKQFHFRCTIQLSIFFYQTRLGFKYYTMAAALAVTKNLKKVVATKKGKFGHNSEVSLRNIILLFACEFFSLAWICFYTFLSPWEKICFLCKEFWKAPSRTGKNTPWWCFFKYLPNVIIVPFLILFLVLLQLLWISRTIYQGKNGKETELSPILLSKKRLSSVSFK